ncbi:hypothetical protein [Sphingobacterium sp. SGR-19]|uniref:hypothetical protein n=1 Tax=Sphingobacterium sp. SGR-19 TaxID=2710886 RepID=UPI0013EB5393|nr:hypothetical protein [Sphingobacterium sp. SGR-19]NGM65788.1 hypothetical protein [Sphingobacterium sp. SGR-19]
MGKDIALQFKREFSSNYKAYREACNNKQIGIGNWRKPSEYEYIEKGLEDHIRVIQEYKIKSIATGM